MRMGLGKRNNNNQRGGGGGSSRMLQIRRAMTDPNYDTYDKLQAHKILSAEANLIDVSIHGEENIALEDNDYSGVIGHFCPLNFQVQKDNPPDSPMFRDVVSKSQGCSNGENVIKVDLKEAVTLSREFDTFATEKEYDVTYYNVPKQLQLKGVVFHESRCGSTLAANTMMAMDPMRHRVYSESSPPIAAIKACGELYEDCSVEASAYLLRDIIYMMGRSNDPNEEHLFFKFQSITTRNMDTFRKAFPETPWIYLYREPVEVMMSQLDVPQMRMANCVRSHSRSEMVTKFVARSGYHPQDLDDEEWCAIHLATLCESAIKNLNDADGLGMAVNYHKDLVHDFLDTVFPKHFDVPLDQEAIDRVMEVSGIYSKNRGRQGEFKADSEEKEKKASDGIREASSLFLEPSFHTLQDSRYNIKDR
eukprot:CAMPEP_0201723362 /NCGR_PEP_ID=MMETSP0593-20130828/7437_1 /ASSEMBLY_ACC=CAM_ASM_000672 /TAXON_ID=267983 /ORGANISM="Skeletonema japonicum, Strain CCMP2506" /LENGTH=418 /DNA_ID=CAMNT_0048214463 /DNA_START=168 /DNA_END=1424 /DNA_ORIENTATION=-